MSLAHVQMMVVVAGVMGAVVALAQSSRPVEKPLSAGTPFWRAGVVEGEPLLFIQEGESRPKASLLMVPKRIVSVTRSSGEVVYERGQDYLWEEGGRELALAAGSRIAFKTTEQMRPAKGAPQSIGEASDGKSNLFFSEGHVFHDLQVVVTYEPAEPWRGWRPGFAGDSLPKTMAKLRGGGTLKLVVFGDSISTGGNASGFVGAKPFQPAYPQLVAQGLEASYGARVTMKNLSVGGKTSQWGLASIGSVSAEEPDLVILAFGMNDAGGIPPRVFAENTRKMMEAVRKARPDVEFILVASMLGNPDWRFTKQEYFPRNRDELAKLCGPGAALADMTSLWQELLKQKKYADITGNGVNHPNDFGQRLYGQVILEMLGVTGKKGGR